MATGGDTTHNIELLAQSGQNLPTPIRRNVGDARGPRQIYR
ncbi:MAG: hypothetical protein ACI8PT_002810 [Gammaproteobacteria bacterium]|jgi:hypothetical protein